MSVTISVTAIDAAGATATATATASQATASATFPLTWNDTRFASNKAGPSYANPVAQGPTGTISNLDWNENPGYSSGDQCWTWTGGTLNMSQCRVDWREGPRIGADSGTFNIDQCYINCVGKSTDHADAFQAYDPGGTGTINITNTTIRAYSDSAAAAAYGKGFIGSTAFFWADDYQGKVVFNNVLLIGGSRVVTINTDTGVTHIDFQNVYFIADPGQVWQFSNTADGGTLVVDNWINVCNATIVNGVVVPGAPIPHP